MSEPLFEKSKSDLLQASSELELWDRLNAVHASDEEPIHLGVIACRYHIIELLGTRLQRRLGDIELEPVAMNTEQIYSYKLSRRFGRTRQHYLSDFFSLVPTPFENIWLFLSVASNRFWRDGLRRLLERLYPTVVRPYFTQGELQSFALNIEEHFLPLETRIVRTNAKGRLRGALTRKKYTSALSWTDTDISSAFGRAQEDNYWFKSLTVELASKTRARRAQGLGVRATISKYGYVSCNGDAKAFASRVLGPMSRSASDRIRFLSSRDRQSNVDSSPRPLKIKYAVDVFSSVDQIRRLLDVMIRYDHANCSVFHSNPYLHVGVVDNYDLSSIDLWVLDKSEILIVPQIRTTDSSLKRTINHIFENFREGELVEASEE